MNLSENKQLSSLVDKNDSQALLEEISNCFCSHYDNSFFPSIRKAFEITRAVFSGNFPGYHACDTAYHDLNHTLDVFLASARIMDGHALVYGVLSSEMAKDLLIASLLHDVGYIRKLAEDEGTGAQFTARHVARSVEFIYKHWEGFDLSSESAARIGRIIMATGMKSEFEEQRWSLSEEMLAGAILGSADLVGQMADRIYLEKLLFLYYEFREACIPGYDTEFDILKKTMEFYEMTLKILDSKLLGVRHSVREHFRQRHGVDADLYKEAIDRQMAYLQNILDDNTSNFRKKLKRLDLDSVAAL